MAFDDLIKGLAVFQEGMKQYATTNAINDANQQLADLNTQQLDKAKQLEAHNQIGQNLALRLGAAGTDAAHIQAVTSAIAPSQGAQYEADVNTALQKSSQTFQSQENSKERANKVLLEKMKLDAMTGKAGQKAYENAGKDFEKRKDVSNIIQHYSDLSSSLDELKQGQGKPESVMFATLAKIGMLKNANGGRPSQQEFAAMGDSPAWYDRVRREVGIQTTNALPEDKQKFWEGVLQRAQDRMKTNFSQIIDSHAKGVSEMNDNIDETKFNTALRAKYGNILGTTSQQVSDKQAQQAAQSAQIQAAQQWLLSPEAKQNPSKAQAVQAALARLKSQGM